MIFDKCENCKYYHPLVTKSKSIFSKKPKLKKSSYIGICKLLRDEDRVQDTTTKLDWCERYERKDKEKNNKHCVYNYTCPNCNTILSEVEDCNYCPECGTRLDWSKNE